MPFSQGPMVCAGKNIAMTEIRAVICALLQGLDFEITEKRYLDTWENSLFEMFTTKRGALPVRVTPHHPYN